MYDGFSAIHHSSVDFPLSEFFFSFLNQPFNKPVGLFHLSVGSVTVVDGCSHSMSLFSILDVGK